MFSKVESDGGWTAVGSFETGVLGRPGYSNVTKPEAAVIKELRQARNYPDELHKQLAVSVGLFPCRKSCPRQ